MERGNELTKGAVDGDALDAVGFCVSRPSVGTLVRARHGRWGRCKDVWMEERRLEDETCSG